MKPAIEFLNRYSQAPVEFAWSTINPQESSRNPLRSQIQAEPNKPGTTHPMNKPTTESRTQQEVRCHSRSVPWPNGRASTPQSWTAPALTCDGVSESAGNSTYQSAGSGLDPRTADASTTRPTATRIWLTGP